ncbi:MAG: hypothetical protein AABZ08_09445 [Planctomycetota bacterium]
MAAEPIILNPIGWGQFRLLGGWRRTLGIAGAYAGGSLLIMILLYRAMRAETTLANFARGSLTFFLLIQSAILVFVGTNAVKRAILRDFTTDMISSHRLTAMSGYTAALGYLTGPTSQCIALTFVNWLICTILAGIAGTPGSITDLLGPTMLFVIMGFLAAFCWSLQVLMALNTRGRISVVGAFVVLGVLSNLDVLWTLPGLALVVPTYLVSTLRRSSSGITPNDLPVITSMAAQLALSFTFFLAAARKYRRDDVAAFSGALGYCLVALCALIAAVGMARVPTPQIPFAPPIFYSNSVHSIATLIALALIAILPVANAARASAEWGRRKVKDAMFKGRRPRSFVEAVAISVILALGILLLVLGKSSLAMIEHRKDMMPHEQMVYCAVAFALSLLTIGGLLRYVYSASGKVGWVIVLYLVFAWCIPMFADFSLDALTNPAAMTESGRSMLFTSSPVGAWIASCTLLEAPVPQGLMIQALLAAGSLWLASRAKR